MSDHNNDEYVPNDRHLPLEVLRAIIQRVMRGDEGTNTGNVAPGNVIPIPNTVQQAGQITSNTTHDMFSSLPREIRDLIMEYVLGNSTLWVGQYGRGRQNETVIRRYISDGQPEGEHPPHTLYHVSHLIADEFRQLWERRFDGRLRVPSLLLRSLPMQAFGGITHLTLTMDQATQALQVVVPHLSPDYPHQGPPTTALVLAHVPAIQHLEVHWDIEFYMRQSPFEIEANEDASDVIPRNVRTALTRLQFFRLSFQVTIHFRAYRWQDLMVVGTIVPTNDLPVSTNYTVEYTDSQEAQLQIVQQGFEQRLHGFGWDPASGLRRRARSPQHRNILEAHSHYDSAPLGWRAPGPRPAPPFPWQTPAARAQHRRLYGNWDSSDLPVPSLGYQNLPPRRALPRPWSDDNAGPSSENADADNNDDN